MNAVAVAAAMSSVIDRWSFWRLALEDPSKIGKSLPVHPGDYELGYYRTRRKGGEWEPVGIWIDDDHQDVGYRGDRRVDDLAELFQWSCRHPISYDTYKKALAGGGFDDEPAETTTPGIGDNIGDADPREALWNEFLGEREMAESFLKAGITTQADADKASVWKDKIAKIKSRATDLFKAEKQPVLDEGKRVDERWRALAHDKDSETAAMINKIRLGMDAFLKAKKAEEEERQRKAREVAAAAQKAAAEAARKAQEGDQQSQAQRQAAIQEADRLAKQARAAEADAEARKVSAGRTGARTSLRVEKRGEITDQDAFYQAVKDRAEVTELLQSLANRAAKSGFELAGMKIVELEKVV